MNFVHVNPDISSKNLSLLPLKCYTFKSPYKQYFSFPFDLMKYILKNPKSSDVLLKLYKTCKYFYSKNQVLIVSGKIAHAERGPGWRYIIENTNNLKNLKTPLLWFENHLLINNEYFFNLHKIYRCVVKTLIISKTITFNEFKLLIAEGTIKCFIFDQLAELKNPEVDVADILRLLTNIHSFCYFNKKEKYSEEIIKKMYFIKPNKNLSESILGLKEISENFDAELLFKFIQNYAAEMCKIYLLPMGENKETILSKLKAAEKNLNYLKSGMIKILH